MRQQRNGDRDWTGGVVAYLYAKDAASYVGWKGASCCEDKCM